VTSLDLHNDGQRLVTLDGDHLIRVWDAKTGTTRSQFAGLTNKLFRVRFAPDGTLLCLGRGEQLFYLLNPNDGGLLVAYQRHTGTSGTSSTPSAPAGVRRTPPTPRRPS
jgi:WD40 repeat protein